MYTHALRIDAELYRMEPGRRRECLYYLALGHYKMGNYEEARRFNGAQSMSYSGFWSLIIRSFRLPLLECYIALLLDKEPTNMQAQSLAQLIDKGVTRGASLLYTFALSCAMLTCLVEGYIGMALAGGAAAVGTLLLAGLIRRAARK